MSITITILLNTTLCVGKQKMCVSYKHKLSYHNENTTIARKSKPSSIWLSYLYSY